MEEGKHAHQASCRTCGHLLLHHHEQPQHQHGGSNHGLDRRDLQTSKTCQAACNQECHKACRRGPGLAGLAKGQCTPGTDCQHGGQVVGTAKGVGNGVGEAVQKSMVAAAITAHMGEGGQRQGCSCGNGSGNQVFSFHSC